MAAEEAQCQAKAALDEVRVQRENMERLHEEFQQRLAETNSEKCQLMGRDRHGKGHCCHAPARVFN